jgi:hypothetical protein
MWLKNKKLIWLLGALIIIFGVVVLVQPAHAQINIWDGIENCRDTGDCDLTSGEAFFLNLIGIILKFLGVAALVAFIYGGITWISSGGSPDKVKRGKDALVGAVVGICIVLFAYIIVYTILDVLSNTNPLANSDGSTASACVTQYGSQGYDCRDTNKCECSEGTIQSGLCPGGNNIVCCRAYTGSGGKRGATCETSANCATGSNCTLTCLKKFNSTDQICAAVNQIDRGGSCNALNDTPTECKSGMLCSSGTCQ